MLKRSAILILAVLLMAQAPVAQTPSQPPSPNAAVQSPDIQPGADGAAQAAQSGQAVAQTNPAPAEAQDAAQARDDRARNERWTLYSVVAAAAFTGLLFLTGAIQAALFVWQLQQIGGQGKLARDEFSATHRPRIRVRLLQIKPLEIGKPVEIGYVVANVGENDAVRIRSEITLKVLTGHARTEQSWTHEFDIADIATGECVTPFHVSDAIASPDWGGVLNNPNGAIQIQGTITYQEKSGIKRKTGFFRQCTDGHTRFSRFGTEDIQRDYEYED